MTSLETFIKNLHQDYFFKEFTFSQTQFSPLRSSNVELADNIVWLDDIFFILQLKQREPTASETAVDVAKWFDNKVLKKAVSQVKNTLAYLKTLPEITISNDKEHFFNLAEAPIDHAIKIILYNDNVVALPEEKRKQKFYVSASVGHIHLFHAEDYFWISKYLVTPTEIRDYLLFRQELHRRQPAIDHLPEQYVLGHYFAGVVSDPLTPSFINSLNELVDDRDAYDLSSFLDRFGDKIIPVSPDERNYYYIQREIAKLARNELQLFKQRLQLSIDKVKADEFTKPYRFYIPRTDCAFVFVPLEADNARFWQTALHNFTIAHKYDSKAGKAVGVAIFASGQKGSVEAYWELVRFEWQHDAEIEKRLREGFPFRPVQTKEVPRYYLQKGQK